MGGVSAFDERPGPQPPLPAGARDQRAPRDHLALSRRRQGGRRAVPDVRFRVLGRPGGGHPPRVDRHLLSAPAGPARHPAAGVRPPAPRQGALLALEHLRARPEHLPVLRADVAPRSRGGLTTWENVVCSCVACNLKKGGRTPDEAHMRLLRPPVRPRWTPFFRGPPRSGAFYQQWLPFLSLTDMA